MEREQKHRRAERILWIDAAKGIGILLVVLGHTIPPFMKYIYGFHMPLFFIISGFLYKEDIKQRQMNADS